jgi:hypothetical protein
MLIGTIRGEIWSLFNIEERVSEIEKRGTRRQGERERERNKEI